MIRNFVAFLGLGALLAATVLGMLAVAGVIGASPEEEPGFIHVRQEEKRVEKQTIDQTLQTGDITWTVHEAKLTNKIETYTLPPETRTGAFIEITFTVENDSELPVTLNQESVALVREGSQDIANADVNSKFVPPDLNVLFNEKGLIEPGESKEGKVYFDLEVPFGVESLKEATGFTAAFKGTDPTTVNEKEIGLEFQDRP